MRARSSQGEMRYAVLAVIRNSIKEDGWAPSIGDIAAQLGISRSVVLWHLRSLQDEGLIERGSQPRQIRVL